MDILVGCPPNFVALSGDDNLTLPLVALGGHGVISVVANVVPRRIKVFIYELKHGGMNMASVKQYDLLNLMRAMFIETNPIPVKTALSLVEPEIFGPPLFRSPMCEMEPENLEKLKHVLEENGL